jgi:hypothetical protein
LIAGTSPTNNKKPQNNLIDENVKFNMDHLKNKGPETKGDQKDSILPSQFSTNYKQKYPYKSR